MELTDQQQKIIAHDQDMKINAVAGSGKTTTLIEYAKTRPKNAPILYLAFNKSVRLEAERKFSAAGLSNVTVETAHSLAYKRVFNHRKHQLQQHGYKSHEIVEILDLQPSNPKDANSIYVMANHIGRFTAYFCNSPVRKVSELNYLDVVQDKKARAFVENFYEQILHNTRLFLAKMYKGEIGITHDFYLKQFQLSRPQLPYQYLLFDEGQDASPVMLDVFLKQKGKKIIVGDTHQQIYGWRYAVNSLEKVDFPDYALTTSFRFDPEIATLAMRVLGLKEQFTDYQAVNIMGVGRGNEAKTHAALARTNLSLLSMAIEQVFEEENAESIYFEGNINSYTYAEEGASVYDILNLYQGETERIRDKVIKSMKDFTAFETYLERINDPALSGLVEIVKKYGRELPFLIKRLKEAHVPDNKMQEADMIFSTVHRCKGMEYDTVSLANDFITEEKISKYLGDKDNPIDLAKLKEEVNLLYVAITRTKNQLNIPYALKPKVNKITWTFNNNSAKKKKKRFSSSFFSNKKWKYDDDAWEY